MPYGEVSVELIEEIFQNNAGITPLEVLVLNDQDALVDLADGVSVTEIAMAVHGEGRLRDDPIRVGCFYLGARQFDVHGKRRENNIIYKRKIWRRKGWSLEARERESRMTRSRRQHKNEE